MDFYFLFFLNELLIAFILFSVKCFYRFIILYFDITPSSGLSFHSDGRSWEALEWWTTRRCVAQTIRVRFP